MQALVKVDFRGDTLFAQAQADGPPIVAVKPIIERIGVDWSNQLARIKRDELLSQGMVIITIPSPGGPQDSVGLPLNLIPGFLFGISEGSVPDPEVRRMVVAYKRECHEVLYQHFYGKAEGPDPTADWDWEQIERKTRMVDRARLAFGRAAAMALWRELGLPEIAPAEAATRTPAMQGLDFARDFLADCTVEDAAGQVQARHLHEAYSRWATRATAPPMTERAFAMCLEALGVRKRRGHLIQYVGIRLKHISEQMG